MVSASEYVHPEDAKALRKLEAIPGFPKLVKKLLSLRVEQLMYGINMASNKRLSPTQLPELYRRLPPICAKLGIKEQGFYLEMNPFPNACTFGDIRIFVTITSGLVEMMNEEEMNAVIAHECGHIACRLVLYHSVGQYILQGADILSFLDNLTISLQLALLYWQCKSELSCDRAGCIVTSPETVASTMALLSGGPQRLTKNINFEVWVRQADLYDAIRNDGLWNKALQMWAICQQNHPFAADLAREILRWKSSPQYQNILNSLNTEHPANGCPYCGHPVEDSWKFSKHCGNKL